jgi:hypothetical protein
MDGRNIARSDPIPGRYDMGEDHTARQRLAPQTARPASLAASTLRRHTPEVGAVCGNPARTDLCGGRSAMSVPTANFPNDFKSCRKITAAPAQEQRPQHLSKSKTAALSCGTVMALSYVYSKHEHGRRSVARVFTRDEARAANYCRWSVIARVGCASQIPRSNKVQLLIGHPLDRIAEPLTLEYAAFARGRPLLELSSRCMARHRAGPALQHPFGEATLP